MTLRQIAHAGLLLASLLLDGRVCRAADDGRSKALQMANDGVADYNAGRYSLALAKFEEAHRTFPAKELLVNISHAQLMLGECDDAFASIRKYAEAVPGGESRKYATQVETMCPEVSVASEPAGASVWVDGNGGRPVGITPWKGRLVPGAHSLILKLAGNEDGHEQFSVEAGHSLQLTLTLPKTAGAGSEPASPFSPPPMLATAPPDAGEPPIPFELPPIEDPRTDPSPKLTVTPQLLAVLSDPAPPPPPPKPAAPVLERPPPPPDDDPDAPRCDSGLNRARQTNCSDGMICNLKKHCVAPRYDEMNGVVSDHATTLMWQQTATEIHPWSGSDAPGSAQVYCQQLNLGGVTDWRLPTLAELFSLVISGSSPSIDRNAFPRTPSGAFWSSTRYASDPAFAWDANFDDGYTYYVGVGSGGYVRCVR